MGAEALDRLLRERGIAPSIAARLAEYGALVLDANKRFNLTGAKSDEALVEHILDSLTLVPYAAGPLADVGSGAGFPAIPLALAAGLRVTLVEAAAKKARFLESTVQQLGIPAVVYAERAEAAARRSDLREQFACGAARAVASATVTAELLLPFIAVGGSALLQRGRMLDSERAALADAALVLGAEIEKCVQVGTAREIVILRKVRPTPQRFPRRVGVPARRPLCENVSRETVLAKPSRGHASPGSVVLRRRECALNG